MSPKQKSKKCQLQIGQSRDLDFSVPHLSPDDQVSMFIFSICDKGFVESDISSKIYILKDVLASSAEHS